MTLDELVEQLEDLQARGHGSLPVTVQDGLWDSNWDNVDRVEVGEEYLSGDDGSNHTRPCIRITT
jgi:hypothetical protein